MLPHRLGPGSRVGVVALAGPVEAGKLTQGLDLIAAEGYAVVEAPNLRSRKSYLAGDDEERLAGLEAVLASGVDALLAARGGYGTTRLLPRLPWARLAEFGGWVVGFSDMTALHAGLAGRSRFATLHGPMVTSLGRHEESRRRLFAWLRGDASVELFRFPRARVVRGGVARGIATGGNLSLLASLVGTPWEPEYSGAVLFLEDVAEPGYRLDRLLTHLRLASRLERAAAVIVGRCVRCGRSEPGWRDRWRDVLEEAVPSSAPVVEGLPFGHGVANLPFPLGVEVEVDTERGRVTWGG